MSTKEDYSEEQWAQVMAAPIAAGMYVILAAPGITSLVGETKAMMDAIVKGDVPTYASDLVGSMVADLKASAEDREDLELPDMPEGANNDPASAKAQLLGQVTDGAAAVASKGSDVETDGYNEWLLRVARSTAEAAREGGILGIGGTRVSEAEEAALAELGAALS